MQNEEIEIKHSKKNMISYGFGSMSREFLAMAFNTFVFFFYETEVGLNVWYIGIALIIFAIYNALNDPLIGYLTNRPFKFTKKWGRRYPWILLGGLPWGFSYFLVFTPPRVDPQNEPLILFGWLLFTICLNDTLHTTFFINFQSLFPDKFRSVTERRTATGIQIMLGVVGVAVGAIVPPLLITYGNLESYVIQGIFVLFFGLITMLIAIPGFKEDQVIVERYLARQEEKIERTSFYHSIKIAMKQKSFFAFVILYTLYQVLVVSMTGSIPYVVRFILRLPSSATALLMAGMLIGVLASTPLWVKLAHRTNDNRKVMLTAGLLLAAFTAPFIFIESYIPMIINMIIWGVALGGFWAMIFPVMSDIIDESVVIRQKREEGVYTGIEQFFGRLGIIIQALSFTLAHSLTGFVEGASNQSSQAIWGIHVHLAVVPMVCILLGSLIFWKFYNLKPAKVSENQLRIKQLKL